MCNFRNRAQRFQFLVLVPPLVLIFKGGREGPILKGHSSLEGGFQSLGSFCMFVKAIVECFKRADHLLCSGVATLTIIQVLKFARRHLSGLDLPRTDSFCIKGSYVSYLKFHCLLGSLVAEIYFC